MSTSTTFHVNTIPQVEATILTPVSRTYGSLELEKLARLRVELAEFTTDTRCSTVIVDLTGVVQHGSGFLSELIAFSHDLAELDRDLIISGDQTGLVQLVGLGQWCQTTKDLVEALNCCGQALAVA